MKVSPIVLFVYNRPWHTAHTVEALKKNELASESDLLIFSDGPKIENDENVQKVREYIKTIDGFKSITIIEREKNMGLANSVIAGVTEIVNKFGKVIVLEDDIVTSKYFLKFMNKCLDLYESREEIFSVSGYNLPPHTFKKPLFFRNSVFLNRRPMPWGWATWKDRWNKADWEVKDYEAFMESDQEKKNFEMAGNDLTQMLKNQIEGKVDSWYVRWCFAHFKHGAYAINPINSYVNNNGFDGTGVHCGHSKKYENKMIDFYEEPPKDIVFKSKISDNFSTAFTSNGIKIEHGHKSLKRFIRKVLLRITGLDEIHTKFSADLKKLTSLKSDCSLGKDVFLHEPYRLFNVEIGDYSYISPNSHISYAEIGKFCSIGPNFFGGWGIHPTNGISTAPMFYSMRKQNGMTLSQTDKVVERKKIYIGNDVFIGSNAIVLDGITIGDGAVIGAGSVVSKDIPPYAVAYGSPIKIMRYRFSDEIIKELVKIEWWNFDEKKLKDVEKHFFDIEKFIEKYKK